MTEIIDAKQRQLAIQPHASFLVQAPAGSGKTELLIQRILALLATVEQPEEILALTFTRKAAAEMRERVLSALQNAQMPRPKEKHAQTTWQLASAALQQSKAKGWRLADYPAQLRIMTIDAFASGLARQLPILSGFGQTPTTADFSEPLYQSAVHDLIQYAQQQQAQLPLKKAINTLILHLDCNIEKLSNLLCAMLARREQWLPDVLRHTTDMNAFKHQLESCLETVIEHTLHEASLNLPESVRMTLPALANFAANQLEETHGKSHILHGLSRFPEAHVDALSTWKALVQLLLVKDKAQARKAPTVREGFPSNKAFKQQKDEMKTILSHISTQEQLLKQLHQIRALPDMAHFDDASWLVLDALFTTLKMLAGQLWQTFEQHKKVDFTEVMLRAKHALGHSDEQGQIIPTDALLRLDHQIKHILVDEFQDTSTLQIDLLSRLTAGWDDNKRTLFLVGDPMQSIYRFRKAEVSLFLQAAQNTLELPDISSLKLVQNFRSSHMIVDWVNQAFSRILPTKDDILAGAISYSQAQAYKTSSGEVKLHVFQQRNDEYEAKIIVKTIQMAKENGKSIGVLARSRSHLHTLMQTLQYEDIPFRALDMLPLAKQSEIIDLRSLTCALIHPADHIAWASLLRSAAVGLSLPSLHAIFQHQPISVWEAIQNYAQISKNKNDKLRLQQFITNIGSNINERGRAPLRKVIESAWLKLAMPCTLSQAQLANADAYFELLEQVEDEAQLDISILDQRLEKLFAKPESQAHAEQVELMTMHGAKGLQWDTVILVGLGKTPRAKDKDVLVHTEANTSQGQQLLLSPLPQSSNKQQDQATIYDLIRNFEQERDALEVARLLYVACTRAERELHLFGHLSESTSLPAASSLLSLLWQETKGHCHGAHVQMYSEELQPDDTQNRFSSNITTQIPATPQRMVNHHSLPQPEKSILLAKTLSPDDQMILKPSFSWAGASAKAVGIALHAALQFVAEIGIENWSDKHNVQASNLMHSILLHEGINKSHMDLAILRCKQGLQNCLQKSSKATWILSSQHQDQHNEWALTYVENGRCQHIVLDRSFIDHDGTRWVIDYKTGNHEGAGLETFLNQELIRYTIETPQLPNYVKALQALEPSRKIKAALYFPMVDGWRVWQDA